MSDDFVEEKEKEILSPLVQLHPSRGLTTGLPTEDQVQTVKRVDTLGPVR